MVEFGVRLSTRLTVAMVALVLVTSAAIGLLIYRNVEAFAIPRALARIDLNVRVLATMLEGAMRSAPVDVRTQGRGVRGLVAAHLAGGVNPLEGTSEAQLRKRLASRFVAELKAKPAYVQYRLVGLADRGREIVRVDRRGRDGAIRIVPDAELRSVADGNDFKAAIALPAGKVYVSPVAFDRAAGVVDPSRAPLVQVAAPVPTEDGKPFGILAITLDLRPAFAAIRAAAPADAPVYVVDEYGRYLMPPDPAHPFGIKVGKLTRVQDDFPQFVSILAQHQTAPRIIRDRAGERFGVGLESVRLAGGPRVVVFQAVPHAKLAALATAIRDASLLGGAIAILCALALAVVLARSLTRPLVQMIQAVEGFAGGAPITVPSTVSGEIGVLAEAFSRMAGEVRDKAAVLTREVEERRRVFDNSVDLILVVDPNGTFVEVSPSSETILGYRPEELVSRNAAEFIHPDDIERARNEMRRARHDQLSHEFEARYVRKDGEVVTLGWRGVWSEPVRLHFFTGRDMTRRIAAEQALKHLAHHDQLTGLPNRVRLRLDLDELIGDDPEGCIPLSVVMFDLDGFKDINDTLGHSTGDRLLNEVAVRLTAAAKNEAQVYRLSGDEFVAVFPRCGDPRTVATHVESMLARIAERFEINDHLLHIGASAGIAIAPAHGTKVEDLIANADLALYEAKGSGGRTCRLFLPVLRAQAQTRRELDSELRRAIAEHEFELYFQPQLRLTDGAVVGAEALLRWRHPTRGVLAPGTFIEALAKSPIVLEAGRWVLYTACEKAAAWRAMGLPPVRIGVNLFPAQFSDGTLQQDVEAALARAGLPAEALELEITENIALGQGDAVVTSLRTLRDMGVGLAFDDFGTGYASLSYLRRYPLSRIKIDQSFVRKVTDNADDSAIVRSIIVMAHNLGLKAIAEGVETPGHAAFLRAEGCDEAQGFLYARPLPGPLFEAFLGQSQAESRVAMTRA